MRKTVLLLLLAGLTLHTHAQITSTFDTDADGWTFIFPSVPLTPNHATTGGNPAGFVSYTYSSFVYTNFTAGTQVWKAPAKFVGHQVLRSMGMNLRFDLQQSQAGTLSDVNGDVIIRSAGSTSIVCSLATKPATAPAWSSYSIKLDETQGWRMQNMSGALATRNQIIAVLTNISSIEIRGSYATNASYTSGLDNVVLEQRTLAPAPVASSLSATSGKSGDVVTITGSGFNTTASANIVRFGTGGIQAVVQSASATQLTVVVPQNASYGPIVVTNTVTGLSTTSAPFNPTFEGGGRIIRASFKPKLDIPTVQIESIDIADVDGDGWNDLVLTNDFSDRVIDIYRNLGLGGSLSASSFDTKVTLSYTGVSVNDTGLWFADLDGDGKPDAVTSNHSGGYGVFVTFRNTSTPGNISFEAPEFWAGASDESPIKFIGDLDGDGRPELVSGEGAIPGGFWLNQNISSPGNIELGSPVFPVGLPVVNGFTHATATDLNGDGKPELIVTNGQGQAIDILQNTSTLGNPSFIAAFQFGTNQYTNERVLVADMNLDGKTDLLYKTSGEPGFHIRLNTDTDGTLTAADFATDVIITGDLLQYGGIFLADINGDGKPDIAASDGSDVGVYENVFSGGVFDVNSFVPAYEYEGTGMNTMPTGPIVADLNGDGKPEIVVGYTNLTPNDKFSIYENVNVHAPVISLNTVSPLSGAVGSTVTITGNNFSTVPAENTVWFGTVKATVLTATANQLTVTVPPGAGYDAVSVTKAGLTSKYHLPFQTSFSSGVTFDNTHFAPPVEFTLTGADYDMDIGDLDNDGKPDIVAEGGTVATTRFRNTHTGGSISTTSLTDNGISTNMRFPHLRDVDGDGLIDMAGGNRVLKNNSTTGNISFMADVTVPNLNSFGFLNYGDINQDGKTDLIVPDGSITVRISENRSANLTGNFVTGIYASFAPGINISRPAANGSVVVEDFDNDGYPDMIVSNSAIDNISIYRNAQRPRVSTNSFAANVELATGDATNRIVTGDLDRDGKLDVLITHGAGTSTTLLIVLHNQSTPGNISFNRIDVTNPSAATTATIADLDGDGKPEIITTSEAGNRFSIFKNLHTAGALSAASFGTPFNTTVTAPRGIIAGDLNLDGKPEIIVTRAAGFLLVYENLVPTVTITITQQPQNSAVCENQTTTFSTDATGTTNILYQWQIGATSAGPFTPINNGGGYSNANTKTLSVNTTGNFGAGFYRCRITGDLASMVFTNPAELVITPIPAAPGVTPGSSCGAGNVLLTASGGTNGNYRWYTVPAGGQAIGGEVNSAYTTPSLAATTTYYVSLVNGICEGARTAVIATIVTIPQKTIITASTPLVNNALTICSTSSLTLSAPAGFNSYLWSTGATTSQITVSATGNYSVTVTASGCTSPASDIASITVVTAPCTNQAPAINTTALSTTIGGSVSTDVLALISDDDNNIVPSSLTIVQQPQSGATVTLVNGMMTIDYQNNPFVGTDVVTLQVCDVFGECAQRQFSIDVIGDIEVFNGISANNDLQNDKFIIEHIEKLDDTRANQVTIYNRWGNVVFEITDYNNDDRVFTGYNKSGNELPSGTYYYKIQFASGRKSESGYLVIKR